MKALMAGVVLGIALWLMGCGPAPFPQEEGQEGDPAALFQGLESRLLEARAVEAPFHVTAEGAIRVDLRGRLVYSREGGVDLLAAGDFMGDSVRVVLRSTREGYEFGRESQLRSAPEPGHLWEGLAIGLTRMGILHNLARLTAGAPPDGVDGGVREWVVVDSMALGPLEESAEPGREVSFSIIVGGEPSGSADLRLDGEGLPHLRRQTIRFPSGEMRVVERYSQVLIDP